MKRRDVLRWLPAACLGMALDPERLLWVPKPMVVVPGMPWQQISPGAQEYLRRRLRVAFARACAEYDRQQMANGWS
jgi:hypothetical protein